MMLLQRRAILIFLSLFVLQILTGVCAQEQANHKEHDLHKEATAATSADNEDMKSAQVQQEGPTKDTHNLAQPQGMLAKIRFEGDLDQPLDYDEVSEMIEKNGAGDALDEINQLDDYIEEEIDQTLDIGPPPQELEPFVEEIEPAVSDTESSKKPAINSMTARASGSPVNSMEATATVSIGQAAVSPNVTKVESSPPAPRPSVAQVTECKTQGQIALTYSEGPSDITAKIARQLSKADARANFFVNATWLYTQQYALVLQNIYNAGHLIGMTYRVKNDDPSALTDKDIREDIINDAQIIEGLIGVSPKYVRLHYTESKDTRTEGIIRDLGFIVVGYNLDSQDYLTNDATGAGSIQEIYSETFKKYKDTYDTKGSFISIQYDLPYTGSLNAVSHIINTIDQEGYTMVRLDGCLNDKEPYKKSANGTKYIGDRFSFSQAGYHQGQKPITLDAVDEAEIKEDEFKIQGRIQGIGKSAASQSKLTSSSVLFAVSWAVLNLLL